jgi:hypothetical protein
MDQHTRRIALLTIALLAGAVAPRAFGAVVYIGLTNGVSAASTRASATASWKRTSAADIPAVQLYATPALADLDGDGVRDALVGQEHGAVVAWRNAGTDGAPAWQRMPAWELASVGARSAPALGDVDGDGLPDLLLGDGAGEVLAFANTGRRSATSTATAAWTCWSGSRPARFSASAAPARRRRPSSASRAGTSP